MKVNEDLKLRLLAGLPIEVDNIGKIKQFTLREIVEIGYSKYNYYLNLLTNIKELINNKENIDLTSINDFELSILLCFYNKKFKNDFLNSLSLFFDEPVFFNENGFYYLSDIKAQRFILDKNYENIIENIKLTNCIKDEQEQYNPANEYAKKLIKMIEKNKRKKLKPKSNIDLYSLISGLSWKSNSINIINIWDLTIYQLYDALSRLEIIDHYECTLRGLFAGTIDSKKINLNEINWAKIIKN